jgi:hypothetical protein
MNLAVSLPQYQFASHRPHEVGHLLIGRMGYVRGRERDTIPKPSA